MPTTTVRLPDDLKDRIARAAKQAGVTSHALILEAIADRIEAEERRNAFVDMAEERYDNIVKSGKTIPWSQLRSYLERRAAGESAHLPSARKLSR